MDKFLVASAAVQATELAADRRSQRNKQPHADTEMALAPERPSPSSAVGRAERNVQLQADAPTATGHGDAGNNAEHVATPEATQPTQEGTMASDETPVQESPVKQEPSAVRTCAFCPSKKHIAAGCVNNACKKCCVSRAEICSAHPKVDPMIKLEEQREHERQARAKKPVLKNEFREGNFVYYGETVTLFSAREFYEKKKLSQSTLNNQDRSLRVDGAYFGQQRPRAKRSKDPKLQAAVASALGKKRARHEELTSESPPIKSVANGVASAPESVPGSGC